MAKAIYSARNALKIKEIVTKRRTGKSWLSPLTLRLSWSENPRFMWYLQKANSTFHFPPTVCQRGWRGGKTSHRSSRCQRSGICPFFFFPCTHPSFIGFNVLQFSRLHFDISKSSKEIRICSSCAAQPSWPFLPILDVFMWIFSNSVKTSSALSPRQQEQCLVARTLLENSINQ